MERVGELSFSPAAVDRVALSGRAASFHCMDAPAMIDFLTLKSHM